MSKTIQYDNSAESIRILSKLLVIQGEHLAKWELILNDRACELLREWLEEENKKTFAKIKNGERFYIYDEIPRGNHIEGFLANLRCTVERPRSS